MRLWSIHPKYLDTKGLLAVWRESLLAQSVLLKGEYTKCPTCKGGCIDKNNEHYPLRCKKCNPFGEIKTPYWNHPQLLRFKKYKKCLDLIGNYLVEIFAEADGRGYNFNYKKIHRADAIYPKPTVTKGQLEYEFEHLQKKLSDRCPEQWLNNYTMKRKIDMFIKPHPLFKVIEGDIELWEKMKKEKKNG